MNLKYLAIGILVGYLAPYVITLIKSKSATDTKSKNNSESILESDY